MPTIEDITVAVLLVMVFVLLIDKFRTEPPSPSPSDRKAENPGPQHAVGTQDGVVTLNQFETRGATGPEKVANQAVSQGNARNRQHLYDPKFTVETQDGIPTLDQFERLCETVPADTSSYAFSYGNEYGHQYRFRAERLSSGKWDVLINDQPSYGSRPENGHATHRHDVGGNRQRICFAPGVEPRDLADGLRKAVYWADSTSRYITTGNDWE